MRKILTLLIIAVTLLGLKTYAQQPEDYFITTWQTNSANESITIPTKGSGYNYSVDWGDGSLDTSISGNATHSYATAGVYQVKIYGSFPRIYFNNSGDKNKIKSIVQWGTNPWTSMNSAFMGCKNLVSIATDKPNFSNVTDMYAMFGYATSFNGDSNMYDWDVSNVTNMHGMFGGASSFNSDISTWDVSNVENMKLMFSHASSFNEDISGWDVSSVNNMDSMFRGAVSFDQNLGGWDVSNVINMKNMMKDVTLSRMNYDALLIGWSILPLNNNIKFDAGNSKYCAGEDARNILINNFNWVIIDGGLNCAGYCGSVSEFTASGWTNGAPDSNVLAVFTVDYNTSIDGGNISACSIMINPGVTLTVSEGFNIRAENDIIIDGDLVFLSSDSGNGELGELGVDGSVIGNATVQRYMSANRSYRMISSAVTTTTSINANWQEGVHNIGTSYASNLNPNPGYGTHITGSSTGAHGFDATISGNPSLFKANIATQAFEPVGNTDVKKLTAGESFLMMVRGDRSINLTDPDPIATETILRATGQLAVGDQTQSFEVLPGQFLMLGNPYQSAVDMESVLAEFMPGQPSFGVLNPFNYYMYDPTYGDLGAYVTVNITTGGNNSGGSSAANKYLQPGQGAQLLAISSGTANITFQEEDKRPGEYTATNATDIDLPMLSVKLFTQENYNNGKSHHDSFSIYFSEGNSNELTMEDAVKPMNFGENLGIEHNGTYLSIEQRNIPSPGEVFSLYSTNYRDTDYALKINIQGLGDLSIYLDDHFTGTSTVLDSGETTYTFSVDVNDELSIAENRFSLRVEERLGLVDNITLSGVRLYPNPLNDNIFYINTANLNCQQIEVNITDIAGRQIYSDSMICQDDRIAVSTESILNTGVYLVTVKFDGEKNTFRLIKQ